MKKVLNKILLRLFGISIIKTKTLRPNVGFRTCPAPEGYDPGNPNRMYESILQKKIESGEISKEQLDKLNKNEEYESVT